MKKQLLYLLPLFALCLGAVSIKWFNDYPAGRPLTTNDIVAIQRTGPNRYVYGDLNDVKNAIGSGGGGAQVWTNDGTFIYLTGANPPDPISYAPGPPFLFHKRTGGFFVGTNAFLEDDPSNNKIFQNVLSLVSSNEPYNYVRDILIVDNESDYDQWASELADYQMNNGMSSVASWELSVGQTNGERADVSIAASVKADGTYIASKMEFATNSFTAASIGLSGVKAYGITCVSNDAPPIPSAATLGVGGYWVGNSNGFLVTIYSLDGLATVMKVLAP